MYVYKYYLYITFYCEKQLIKIFCSSSVFPFLFSVQILYKTKRWIFMEKQIKHCKNKKIKNRNWNFKKWCIKLLILEKAYKKQDAMQPLQEFWRNDKNNNGEKMQTNAFMTHSMHALLLLNYCMHTSRETPPELLDADVRSPLTSVNSELVSDDVKL